MKDVDLRSQALIAASRLGLEASKVTFSSRLEWVGVDGEVVLRQAVVDGVANKVVLYLDAMKARWSDDEFHRKLNEVLRDCIASLKQLEQIEPLYVRRDLLNSDEVAAWAKTNGFKTVVDDMHVTVVFSKKPINWNVVSNDDSIMSVTSGSRGLARLGIQGEAVVLKFSSSNLQERWKQFIDAGASWDWPEYQPHVTLTYDGANVDLDIPPYAGELIFGPEIFQSLDLDWKDTVSEK